MHYHLLDGDWASNACSWQWVAGANSSKKYVANQENINRFTLTSQSRTYLDTSYEALDSLRIPDELRATQPFLPETPLPATSALTIDPTKPTLIYTSHNLDPFWHRDVEVNRILLLDPEVFSRYPVSDAVMRFILKLSANIPGIQVYTGSFRDLKETYAPDEVRYKEHPFNIGFSGIEEPREWISEAVTGYYPSFFAYWKQVSKRLY
jgi:deoxyribodipyrimidine photo-lyase